MKEKLLQRAKKLRSSMTEEEQMLWQELRAKRFIGTKFRRQQVIGFYIVDFICFSKKLIIELDGIQHIDRQSYDEQRTRYLNQQGFKVLRFWNSEIHNDLDRVLDTIFYAIDMDCPSL
ncbi:MULTISPECIES: endonuclease domain-containing protein [Actinobacillus]|uniref:Protein of uncharacterized function (DUF559) n=1 Tax=Actinobacillus lignieresii TaxID=720 RepID=A0A380TRY8_ACTLI|nr:MULTISPECIES: endonuclease domain-containing protein [Actinobacillus]WGE92303.1 endonuclease domain-containing protein [Actinobacillus genomosp. 1]SUT90759.1 Protein of uncharacterised function (DUF559) [Actinobacillus lignieresii]